MTDTKTTLTWVLKDEVSGPAKGIGSSLGGLVNPTTLAIGGIAALTGVLALAAKGAAEEQVNLAKLDASLKANVEGWKGNTDAIEELISQRELLGFSDDEQRASLATLLAGTKDVTEAQDLQALAMDLARLKSVDLETATNAVAKANQGSTRELKALGIEITDSMTSTEALTALQAAAAGQAEAYGDTLEGKWEAVQIKFGDVIERVGTALLPALETITDWLLVEALPALEDFAAAVGPTLVGILETLGAAFKDLMDNYISPMIDALVTVIDAVRTLNVLLGTSHGLTPQRAPGGGGPLPIPPATNVLGMNTVAPRIEYHAGTGGRASGGDVDPWGVYTVGEQGPETLVMGGQGGSIIPGGGGGAPVVIPVMIDGREVARIVDEHLYYDVQRASPVLGRS